jgi:MFS-type transporter involved in bile tolerance (Atg22 family)
LGPLFKKDFSLNKIEVEVFTLFSNIGALLGCLISALFSEKIGRKFIIVCASFLYIYSKFLKIKQITHTLNIYAFFYLIQKSLLI